LINKEENQYKKVNLSKHILPKASKFFILKYFFYSIVLAILLYLILSKLATLNPEKDRKIDDDSIEIELEKEI
jgi:hypothetical protein